MEPLYKHSWTPSDEKYRLIVNLKSCKELRTQFQWSKLARFASWLHFLFFNLSKLLSLPVSL